MKIRYICSHYLFLFCSLFLMSSCFWRGTSYPEAVHVAQKRFVKISEYENGFLQLVDTNCLAPGCVVIAEGSDFQRLAWPVPENGYIVLLDEEPSRHNPNKQLRRIIAYISRDRDSIQFVTQTNGTVGDVSVKMSNGIIATNIPWSAF